MTKYHCCVDLDAIVERNRLALMTLREFARDEVENKSDDTIVTEAVIRRAKGAVAWPLCDHADKLGHCKGHAQ